MRPVRRDCMTRLDFRLLVLGEREKKGRSKGVLMSIGYGDEGLADAEPDKDDETRTSLLEQCSTF